MSDTRLTPEQRELIAYCCEMRICVIETGSPTLRAADVERQGKSCQYKIKALDANQRRLIDELEGIAELMKQSVGKVPRT